MIARRSFLQGTAALPLAAVPTVAGSSRALAGSADPFATYHQRIIDLHALIDADPGEDEAERMMDAWGDIDRKALAGRPTTFAGAAGALAMARREFVQFKLFAHEGPTDPSNRLILHLIDGAISVLQQAAEGGDHV